jgi:hypothetical protein
MARAMEVHEHRFREDGGGGVEDFRALPRRALGEGDELVECLADGALDLHILAQRRLKLRALRRTHRLVTRTGEAARGRSGLGKWVGLGYNPPPTGKCQESTARLWLEDLMVRNRNRWAETCSQCSMARLRHVPSCGLNRCSQMYDLVGNWGEFCRCREAMRLKQDLKSISGRAIKGWRQGTSAEFGVCLALTFDLGPSFLDGVAHRSRQPARNRTVATGVWCSLLGEAALHVRWFHAHILRCQNVPASIGSVAVQMDNIRARRRWWRRKSFRPSFHVPGEQVRSSRELCFVLATGPSRTCERSFEKEEMW